MRRILFTVMLLSMLFAGLATPVTSQVNGQAMLVVKHYYHIESYGSGVLKESITFSNPGDSTVQIPSLQLGIPDSVASRAVGLRFVSADHYTTAKSENNDTTLFTITPQQPALAPHATSSIVLESYVKEILNATVLTNATTISRMLVMITPSINHEVSTLGLTIGIPSGVALTNTPAGFGSLTNDTGTFYTMNLSNDTAETASAQYLKYSAAGTAYFHPAEIFLAERTLTASADGTPQITDTIVVNNKGKSAISSLTLSLISRNITEATVVASSSPPLINPTPITVAGGAIDLTKAPFNSGIQPGDNLTLTLVYNVPTNLVTVSGGRVGVSIPYTPPVDAIVDSYRIGVSLPAGITAVNSTAISLNDVTPFVQGQVTYQYSLNVGWGAARGVPLASLLFAVVFIGLALYRHTSRKTEEEEGEGGSDSERFLSVVKAFEERLALVAESVGQLASKQAGTVGKTDFDRTRVELDALKSKALQRLSETKQSVGPGRYSDLLTQIHDAARQEDRATKDLINLYEQYHHRRMKEQTFQRLLPSYRRRLDGAVNHVSDLLSTAQKEIKPD